MKVLKDEKDKPIEFILTPEEYENLSNDSMLFNALIAAGVDNWDGYSSALEILEEWERDQNA